MPIYSTMFILQSVGRHGKNARPDVVAVQQRLNDLMNAPRVPLEPDGICGRKTRAMIRDFQISVCGFKWPDARVDPNGKTLSRLNDPASEGIWGRMSIPPEPKSGGGGSEPIESPKTEFDAVDAAIEDIKATATLTATEEKNLRRLFEKLWKAHRGDYTMTKTGLSETDLRKWKTVTKYVFQTVRISLVIASTHVTLLGSASVIASFAGAILLAVGLTAALLRALASGYRVHGALASAHYIVWWAHGGPIPTNSRLLDRREAWEGEINREKYNEAWREGKTQAQTGLNKAIAEMARQTGLAHDEARQAMRALLRCESETTLLKTVLAELAADFKTSGDVQVANGLQAHADARGTRYPM